MTAVTCTAFIASRRFASGPIAQVALSLKDVPEATAIKVFDDETGREIDLRARGTGEEIAELRSRGRPKLGVVAREVTLLPRHWTWLAAQPGGASVTLRKLVDEARRESGDRDRTRAAQEAAYHFMSVMAGNLPGFEEAAQSLFAYDRRTFADRIAAWPEDVRDFAIKLAFADLDPSER
jgi:hypothetical protein